MSEAAKDTARITQAMKILVDGRDPQLNMGEIMVTLEGLVTALLLVIVKKRPHAAVHMLNEGLTPRVEERIALFEHQERERTRDR